MRQIYRSIMDAKEDLLDELENYKCAFSPSLYDYLESVANLEISVLRQENISVEQARVLAELKFYRDLLYYNVCCRALTYKEYKNSKYFEEDYYNSFSISYGNTLDNVALINVSQADNYKVTISLANYFEPTLTDITKAYAEKLEQLRENYTIFKTKFKCGKSNSEYLYERIKGYDIDDLKNIWYREKEFAQKQNLFYKKFMEDTDLEYTTDFTTLSDGSLELNEEASRIYIKKKTKTPIFR